MGSPIIAIVTGANRGIGHAICQTLAADFQEPLLLYATSRKGENLGFKPSSAKTQIEYPSLDIASTNSINELAKTIQRDHHGLDVLINNAGAALDSQHSPENVKTTLDTNYRGTLKMCQTFIPLLRSNGRIVNVSSTASSLSNYSDTIKARFQSSELTLEDLENMMNEYQECTNQGTESQNGWPTHSYSVSKAATNAMTAILARENQGLIINSCCPGWVATDMGKLVNSTPPKNPGRFTRIGTTPILEIAN
ncbi:MAG: hypothetical protein Q9195_003191 [Heterodermia aff. obscurata]